MNVITVNIIVFLLFRQFLLKKANLDQIFWSLALCLFIMPSNFALPARLFHPVHLLD